MMNSASFVYTAIWRIRGGAPDDLLDLLLVLEVNLLPIFRPHQHGGVAEGGVP